MFKKLIKESFAYGGVTLITSGIAFITIPFFTRMFTIEEYGKIGLITSIAMMLSILYGLSLETAFTRYFNDKKFNPKKLFREIIKFQTLYGLTILCFGLIVSYKLLGYFDLRLIFAPLCIVFFSALLVRYVDLAKAKYRMNHDLLLYISISLISAIGGAITSVFLVYYFETISSYFFGLGVGAFLAACFAFFKERFILSGIYKTPLIHIPTLLRFSLPLLPAALANFANSSLDRWILAFYYSTVEVAIYTVGVSMASLATIGISVLSLAFLPHSMEIIQKQKNEADKLLETLLRYYSIIASAGVILLQLVSLGLVKILAPVEYASAVSIVGYLALSAVFFGYTYFSTLGSWKAEKSSDYSWAICLGFTINVVLNLVLVPPFGIIGAAIATASGMLITSITSFILSHIRYSYSYAFGQLLITNILLIGWIAFFVHSSKVDLSFQWYIVSGVTVIVLMLVLNFYKLLFSFKKVFK